MAVCIRMRKVGTKNVPMFRVVVTDSRCPRDGRFLENLGTYDPRKAGDNFKLNFERLEYWVSKGARMSDTVRSFYKKLKKAAAQAA